MDRKTFNDLQIPGKKIVQIVALIFLGLTMLTYLLFYLNITAIPKGMIWIGTVGYILTILYIICAIFYTRQAKSYGYLITRFLVSVGIFIFLAIMMTRL